MRRLLANFFGVNRFLQFLDEIGHNGRLLKDLQVQQEIRERISSHPNPLSRMGKFGFSQTDEDGIILEIVKRLEVQRGRFIELGSGDGLENNTLVLISLGWKGVWVDALPPVVDAAGAGNLSVITKWVTRENFMSIFEEVGVDLEPFDVVSIDLDGNDWHLVKSLLEGGVEPKLFIVEYNGKFPPGVQWIMPYQAEHSFNGDDYFGASISAFVELFATFGYFIVCCNASTGVNAFFIKDEFKSRFDDVPETLEEIFSLSFYSFRLLCKESAA
jgi:hypothetical protein